MAKPHKQPIVPKSLQPTKQPTPSGAPGGPQQQHKNKNHATVAVQKQSQPPKGARLPDSAPGSKRRHPGNDKPSPAAKKHKPSVQHKQPNTQAAPAADGGEKTERANSKRPADSSKVTAGKPGKQQAAAPGDAGAPPAKKHKIEAGNEAKGGPATQKSSPATGGVSSNWAALRQRIGATGEGAKKRAALDKAGRKPASLGSNTGITPVLALDCEMVGVGPDGTRSALARVAVVNQEGNTLLDVFVKTKEKVTDYRTKHSGVRPSDLSSDKAVELEEAQTRVAALIKGKLLVGHGLVNDMAALMLDHPRKDIRDTAKYAPLMRSPAPGRRPKPRALRHLAAEHLGLDIQAGEHSPVDDARAALYLYLKHRKDWEHAIKTGGLKRSSQTVKDARKAALSAAVAAASAATSGAAPGAGGAGAADAKVVLSKGQLRAIRQGRSLRKTKGVKAVGGAADSKAAKSGPAGMRIDEEEVQHLVAVAAAQGARGVVQGSKKAQAMMQIMSRDVRQDPLADL